MDVTLVEYPADQAQVEVLRVEPLVWVKAPSAEAWRKRPLPLSMVDEQRAFRPVGLDALDDAGIAWRTVFESRNIEATAATVRAGLEITTWLAATVPPDLEIASPRRRGLPALPWFAICLRLPVAVSPAAQAFVGCVRESMVGDAAWARPAPNVAAGPRAAAAWRA